jgi:copper chaperone CopZ
MKYILALMIGFFLIAPAHAETTQKAHDIVVKINGMVCDVCAQSVKKTFLKNEGVKDVTIDLDSGEVRVDLKPKAALDDAEIKKMIDYAGYDIVSIKR